MFNFLVECDYIQVPISFIKEHLKEANGAYVKVYLYILTLASVNRKMSFSDIARELNLIESDILNAVEYWKKEGVFKQDGENILINGKGDKEPVRNKEKKESPKPVYDSLQVAERIKEDTALSEMMGLAQELFGRILTSAEMESVYWFYDGLKFSPEAIMLLLEYCVNKGKTGMKYIEKVALDWSEKGATEAHKICEIIEEEKQRNGYLYAVRKALNIADRSLSQSEEKYIMKWKNEYAMSEEMVALAYEYCIIQTAKLSFPYMDKIMERWHKQGIHDVISAEQDNKNFKERRNSDNSGNTSDYNDLENLTRGRFDK